MVQESPVQFKINKINIYESPILSAKHNNSIVHLVLDTGATASLIKRSKCKELGIKILPTIHKAVQIDGTDLSVVGEIHVTFTRDSINLYFSALVVEDMCCDILAGTGFHKENDVYSRMATEKIVIQGKYYFNSTPHLALAARIELPTFPEANSSGAKEYSYPILIKANKSGTFLPGEGFTIPIKTKQMESPVVVIEPRTEAPSNFLSYHLQDIENGIVFIRNMSQEPIKIKKNTPVCQIRETRDVNDNSSSNSCPTISQEPTTNSIDLSTIKLDPNDQFNNKEKLILKDIINKYKDVFRSDLPGYNHKFGKVEASFTWASKARPTANRARMPDYNAKGSKLYNEKALELASLGVLKRASDFSIQPAFKNNSFLVKKQASTSKSWDECTLKDVRMVTSFSQLQKYISAIPAKIVKRDKILQMCANWKYMAEIDLTNMFFQIPMKKSNDSDIKKLSYLCIQTDEGTYYYDRAPQGLPGISEYEEELTDTVFGDLVIQGKVVKYADNIYLGGSTKNKFIEIFEEVLIRLNASNLRINPSKLIVGTVETTIMGWHWNKGILTPSVHKLNPLSVCEEPQTITGLRSFLGGMRIHKRCLQGVDNVSKPLDEACPSNISGREKVNWTPEMKQAFRQCQEILKSPKAVVVPRTSDQLVQIGDGALSLPATGTVLVAIREGVEGYLPVGYFGFRVKGSMSNWSPCEIEAYTHAAAMEENSIYFRESENPIICLTDNSPVVDAAKKIKQGQFSSSPRLQTLITAVQRYGAEFVHISGKLPTTLIDIADFCSRNPIECTAKNCSICKNSEHPDTSYSTIKSSLSPFNGSYLKSKTAWKHIQESSPELKRAMSHIQSGTAPSKKEKKISDLRTLVFRGSISKEGLLIVKSHLPMELIPTEQIVVPKEYSLSVITLLHNDPKFNHPKTSQLEELTRRHFFIFHRKKLCQDVVNSCMRCQAEKKMSPQMLSFQTETKSENAGTFFNADVIQRCSQRILVVRDNLTSFTQTIFIPNEQKETLRENLISIIYRIKPNMNITVRVDPHSSFKALQDDKILKECNITLEIGDEKNKNKNGVAEKAIQELHDEIVKVSGDKAKIDQIDLAKATDMLNSRIRFHKRSSKELWMRRNQDKGENIEVNDVQISDEQNVRRSKDNKKKEKKCKKPLQEYQKGDIVFIISDRNKIRRRNPYLVIDILDNNLKVVKFAHRSKGLAYKVKQENVFKANPALSDKIKKIIDLSESENDINEKSIRNECYLCKKANYLDFLHDREMCLRFPFKKRPAITPQKISSDSDSEASMPEENTETVVQELIDRNYLLSFAESSRSSEENIFDFHTSDEDHTGVESRSNQDNIGVSDNQVEEIVDEVVHQDKFSNPPNLPNEGDRIVFFNPNTKSVAKATVLKMQKTLQKKWPGWRNIKVDDEVSPMSINMDLLCNQCALWRYECQNVPQIDGNYTDSWVSSSNRSFHQDRSPSD